MMHGNLTANTFICSFFVSFSLSLLFSLLLSGSPELCDDAYEMFTFDLSIRSRVKCIDGRAEEDRAGKWGNEVQNRKEGKRAANTNSEARRHR